MHWVLSCCRRILGQRDAVSRSLAHFAGVVRDCLHCDEIAPMRGPRDVIDRLLPSLCPSCLMPEPRTLSCDSRGL